MGECRIQQVDGVIRDFENRIRLSDGMGTVPAPRNQNAVPGFQIRDLASRRGDIS